MKRALFSSEETGAEYKSSPNKDMHTYPASAPDHPASWYAFYVKPRHEKKVLDRLQEQFETGSEENDDQYPEIFCPMKEERVKWSDRWKTVTKPYIPGYLFACVTEKQRLSILNDPSIFRTVCWKGRPAKIRDEEIELVKRVIGDPNVKDLRLEGIQPGDRVEVTGGELMNMNGIVVKVKGGRATILLESMHCNMTFAVDRSMLKVEAEVKVEGF
jgi:transcription antitermination factor NusG